MPDSTASKFSEKTLYFLAAVFFCLILLGTVLISPHNQLPCRGNARLPLGSLGERPILQVELAWKACQLACVLTPGNQVRNVADARTGNNLDTFLFIPAYAGFLVTLGLILARRDLTGRGMLRVIALVIVPLAAVCDWMENRGIAIVLIKLENHVPLANSDALWISTPSLLKWCLLAFVLIIYGFTGLRRVRSPDRKSISLGAISALALSAGVMLAYMLVRYGSERWIFPSH
jgi:hypothetical protein